MFILLIFKLDSIEVGVEGNLKGSGIVLMFIFVFLVVEVLFINFFFVFKNCWRIKVFGIWYYGSSWW